MLKKAPMAAFWFLLIIGFVRPAYSGDDVDSLRTELVNADIDDSIELLTEMGRVNFRAERFQLALENFYTALRLSERAGDAGHNATLKNNIAAVYYKTDDLRKALEYFTQSLELERELSNQLGVSKSLNNIAIIYNELGEYEHSLTYYEDALAIRQSLNDRRGIATIYNNMGLVYVKLAEHDRAISYYQKSLEISRDFEDYRSVANTLGNISRAYLLSGRYTQAIAFAEQGLEYSQKSGSRLQDKDNYQTLYTIYKELNHHEKALEYFEKYEWIKDSLNSTNVASQLDEIKLKYETERKESENMLLKSEREAQEAVIRTQKIFVIAAMVVLLLVSALAYALYKNAIIRRHSIRMLEEQNREIENKHRELEKLNHLKNKIFSVISHEVRSPLNSLVGTIDLLNSGYLSPEEFFRLSSELKQKVNQTSIFLTNVLIWAKSQMNGVNITKEEFQIDRLVNDILDILKEQADMKGVEIERQFENQLSVGADKGMIGIVAKNLIANAIKYTKKGGKVVIKTYRKDDQAVVEVVDQGSGIPEDLQQTLFGVDGFMAGASPDRNGSTPAGVSGEVDQVGSGLGLILSKILVEENGGHIWLRSEEGKGSTFSFSVHLN